MKKARGETQEQEFVELLHKELKQVRAQNTKLQTELDDLKKGSSGAQAQLSAEKEMHAQKIKSLLKSINNLKKELATKEFSQK